VAQPPRLVSDGKTSRAAAGQGGWSCVLCDAALVCCCHAPTHGHGPYLLPSQAPCRTHGMNSSTAHAGLLVVTEVPYCVFFITFYHLKDPKSPHSVLHFCQSSRGAKEGRSMLLFSSLHPQSSLDPCFLLSRLKHAAAIPKQKFRCEHRRHHQRRCVRCAGRRRLGALCAAAGFSVCRRAEGPAAELTVPGRTGF